MNILHKDSLWQSHKRRELFPKPLGLDIPISLVRTQKMGLVGIHRVTLIGTWNYETPSNPRNTYRESLQT